MRCWPFRIDVLCRMRVFSEGSASARYAGMEGTRGSESKTGSASPRACTDSERTSRNMEPTPRGLRRAAEPMHGTSSVGFAGDSGAHSALSRFRMSGSDSLSSRGSGKARGRGNVSREISRLPLHFVPFQCAIESPAKPADLSAHVSTARPQTARGERHVPACHF